MMKNNLYLIFDFDETMVDSFDAVIQNSFLKTHHNKEHLWALIF